MLGMVLRGRLASVMSVRNADSHTSGSLTMLKLVHQHLYPP